MLKQVKRLITGYNHNHTQELKELLDPSVLFVFGYLVGEMGW